jgi:hypothetical protein
MTQRRMPLGAKILVGWWLTILVVGLIFNFWMALKFFKSGALTGGLLFSVFGVGCIVYLYRTYSSWDEFPRNKA